MLVKSLFAYMRSYKKECILGPLFKLLEATFELLVPLVMAAVIDVGIARADRGYVGRMCLVMAGLGVVGLVCSITAQFFAAKASVGIAAKLRHNLFAHIQTLSYTEMDTVGTSTLITRMTSDINQVQNGLNLALRLLLRSPFVVFGAMVMAFTIDVPAALVFVVAIPLLAVVVFGVMLWTMPRYKQVQAGLDKVLGATRENLTGVRVIRAFGRERRREPALPAGEQRPDKAPGARGQNLRPDEPRDLRHHQPGGCGPHLGGGCAGGYGHPHPGGGGGFAQLYVPDSGGAD